MSQILLGYIYSLLRKRKPTTHTVLRLELVTLLLNALPEPLKADDADDSSLISYTQAQTAESTLLN